jgi:hypothetical protein
VEDFKFLVGIFSVFIKKWKVSYLPNNFKNYNYLLFLFFITHLLTPWPVLTEPFMINAEMPGEDSGHAAKEMCARQLLKCANFVVLLPF